MIKKVLIIILLLGISDNLFASIEDEIDSKRFERKDEVLIDKFAQIIWQDNNVVEIKKNWQEAKKYCENLTLNDYDKWELPTKEELLYVYHIKDKFKSTLNGSYWSSTEKITLKSNAWRVSLSNGYDYLNKKEVLYNVRCIHHINKSQHFNNLSFLMKFIQQNRDKELSNKYIPLYKKAVKENSLKSYTNFIQKCPHAPQVRKAWRNIYRLKYNIVKQKNNLSAYKEYIRIYPDAFQVDEAWKNIYKIEYQVIKQKNDIAKYIWFIKTYPKAIQVKDAQAQIYKVIKNKNNIAGYEWFITKYPYSTQVHDALNTIYKITYNKAESINTLKSYNTYIYSYPLSSFVEKANNKAYKIEEKEYTDLGILSFLGKEDKMEKKARKLLIKAKQLEEYPFINNIESLKVGYLIVVNRMYKLLQDKFDDTDATLRYLESQGFKNFLKKYRTTMNDIEYIKKIINQDRLESYSYIKKILKISFLSFKDNNIDKNMAKFYVEQHTEWKKYMQTLSK